MATLRSRRKLAVFLRETPENTMNTQSQNTLLRRWLRSAIAKFLMKLKGGSPKKLSQEFSRTESRILGALSKLDEVLLNPQVRNCSVVVPGTSRNINSENRQPTGDRSVNDPCPDVVFSACHTSKLIDSEQKETHHSLVCRISWLFLYCWFLCVRNC